MMFILGTKGTSCLVRKPEVFIRINDENYAFHLLLHSFRIILKLLLAAIANIRARYGDIRLIVMNNDIGDRNRTGKERFE
mmetsp:Transcript_12994/g.26917  ORF Transcript_12994/g.26917 Transcript_12994/m.26917 type:complete len:80 (+) Transcript_12994:74-313(+)